MSSGTPTRKLFIIYICGLILVTAGCARFNRGPSAAAPLTGFDEETAGQLLRDHVNGMITAANEMHENDEKEMRTAEPYHFRISEYFPEQRDRYRVSMRRLPGNRARFEATVAIPCHRTMTRYHRSQPAAERDDRFIREEGTLYAVFSLTGRAWIQQYSYFEPATVKRFDNGRWVETPYISDRFVDDKRSVWQKMFGWLT